jgi:enoyl-CoA hydratase/carnithine racemase
MAADRPSEHLYVERHGQVATLWINRAEKKNSFTLAMWQAIPGLLADLAVDPGVRVLVVRGTGDTFSAGADIGELGSELADGTDYRSVNQAAEDALASFPRPTIAMVRGACIGGGCEVAVACDLRFADNTARFGITPARLGIVYPAFAVERFARLVGTSAARYILYSAELIDAEHALRIGLIDELLPPELLEARVHSFASILAGRSLLTQQAVKEMVASLDRDGSIDRQLTRSWEKESAAGPDIQEGVSAFKERREPKFSWTKPYGKETG